MDALIEDAPLKGPPPLLSFLSFVSNPLQALVQTQIGQYSKRVTRNLGYRSSHRLRFTYIGFVSDTKFHQR